jgi:hypothetical protein
MSNNKKCPKEGSNKSKQPHQKYSWFFGQES